ncbi:butyrate kinase [Flammeovirga yaeyamensis]|uniref:Probable butyrate kinase n=1 Tax=Flammeovirga yaeyamensis TaxID=367791 RepID=A0AAX1N5M0_9BACT|nr:butyrate kinase [Flammeovirga yaeyamensis]MBB3697319.1 butyrate kinase [Flammeovirga yaeyamensis]NMF36013.1 butyrate kinase [Flammeovirga yaeyamensis]QWG02749.1 butyrate kinase [Flammeovirga yaeyamensis]
MQYILAINPGSTSTKVALYQGEEEYKVKTLRHSIEELQQFQTEEEQLKFRKEKVVEFLKEEKIDISSLAIVMARGGLSKPIESGVYLVDENLLHDLKETPRKHASNWAAKIAFDIASEAKVNAYIADPVVVDELSDIARMSGHPKFPRVSVFHALNQKAVGRTYAEKLGKKYEDLNLIITHMGGGVSVGAHLKGKVVDVNQALDGDGPFSPERSGSLPVGDIIRAAFSGAYTQQEMISMVVGKGGMSAYLNTIDAKAVEEAAQAGSEAELKVMEAMIYQIAKSINSMVVPLQNKVDAVILTGGMAYGKWFTGKITEYVNHIADVEIFPGEDEMWALALNANQVINNKITPKEYGYTEF